jgi:hypothetical protein
MRRLVLVLLIVSLAGCARPNRANIELRREVQQLQERLETLQLENDQLRSQLRVAESRGTIDTLPQARLESLFTVAGVRFGRLTGRDDEGQGLQVYLTPFDGQGDSLKAAGGIAVEAFDLAADETRLGRWQFDLDQADSLWRSGGLFSGYVLACPTDTPLPAGALIVKVTFTDGLTGRTFEATREVE